MGSEMCIRDRPEVDCANGISASGSTDISIDGSGAATVSGSVTIEPVVNNCEIELSSTGSITIDVPDVECANGMTTSGSATVSGSGYATGDVTIDLTASGCDLTLSGSGSIDVPEPECADGMSTSGSASITTSGGASGGGDISLSLSGCCLLYTSDAADE